MSIKKDNVSVTAVKYNSQDVNKVILDNKCVWCKPFTYTQGTLPTGVASLTCTRSSTDEPTALTGTIANGDTIYYDDKLYWEATASTGYRITAVKGSGSPVTVSGAITGTTASGLTSERISGTISQGTLPTGVASITCYRKAYNENSFSEYTGSTIYYGDQFYWTATATTEYNNPSLTYNNSSKVYTWNGNQGGSIDSVSASGLSAGTRRSFTISFGVTANKALYGSWSKSSQTAYYGDKITVSNNSVTCYKWDATSTARWTVTVTASSNTAEYTYSAVTIAESNIASVTAAATFTAWNTRTVNLYTVTIKAGTGVNSVFLSTNQNALSGSSSGTTFTYNSTVYGFAAIDTAGYKEQSDWSYVGNGNIFRVGSNIVASTNDFGTVSAYQLSGPCTISVSSNHNGLQSVYLSASSEAHFGSSSLSVTPGTTVYGFAVLGRNVSPNQVSGWTLISGSSCEYGAIYRVGSKTPYSAGTTTFTINLKW